MTARDAADDRAPPSADAEHGRRRLLAAAGASLSALATAGCLSNPWGPQRPGGASTTAGDEGGDGASSATTTASGTDPAGDGDATRTDDSTTTDDGTAGGGETTGEQTTAETATATEVPPEETEPDQVVEVAPDGFRFAPETFTIDAGDTVHWRWKDSGHNVRVREKPEDSDWTGTPGDASDTYGEGYLHAHTFDAPGEYECFCAPHQTLGLEGSFTVR